MKYRANPVEVDAYQITKVEDGSCDGTLQLGLANGQTVRADAAMLARMVPQVGDYWVVQADGYTYLNPKAVFERKYTPLPAQPLPPVSGEYVELSDEDFRKAVAGGQVFYTPDRRPTDPKR